MVITKVVKAWLKVHDWPTAPVRIGPGACGQRGCRKQHAYAEAVGAVSSLTDEVFYAFVFDRPCDPHESAWDPRFRRKMGLRGLRGQP